MDASVVATYFTAACAVIASEGRCATCLQAFSENIQLIGLCKAIHEINLALTRLHACRH
jgi:hypothetical protein